MAFNLNNSMQSGGDNQSLEALLPLLLSLMSGGGQGTNLPLNQLSQGGGGGRGSVYLQSPLLAVFPQVKIKRKKIRADC